MTSHPEDDSCPPFKIKIIGAYRDCLTRQVSEALKIHNSKDELLNSKNEYASNHLTRIVVDMDSVARKKLVQKEEEEDRQAARRLETFKAAKRRPKRSSHQEEQHHLPAPKRQKKNTQIREEDEMDLGQWLLHAEARCCRVGNLKARLDSDHKRITRIMDQWKQERVDKPVHAHDEAEPGREDPPILEVLHTLAESLPPVPDGGMKDPPLVEGGHEHAAGGSPEVGTGSGDDKDPPMVEKLHALAGSGEREDPPLVEVQRVHAVDRTMNDRIMLNISTRAVPSPVYNLTSYAAWWKRIEREETKFYREVRNEEEIRRKKKEENRRKEEGKKDFVRKFFPNCKNSPGGKTYLNEPAGTEHVTPGAVGKIVNGRTVIPKNNLIFKKTLFQTKVKTNLTHIRDKDPAIEVFAKPIMRQSADMRKVGDSGNRDHLGQIE